MAEQQDDSSMWEDIKAKFVGKWKFHSSENFDEFLSAQGVPYIPRQMAKRTRPDCEISITDEKKLRVVTSTMLFTQDDIIEFNKDFEREMKMQKAMMKCHATYENGKITMTMDSIDGATNVKHQTITRHIEDGKMVLTMNTGDVVAKRSFERA